jgi:hypothetical protein
MDNFSIINFNERMKFQVYNYEGCSHDNVDDEIIDRNTFVLVDLGFRNPEWKPMVDAWFRMLKGSIFINNCFYY